MGTSCQCTGCHGSYRASAKNSQVGPPSYIAADHKLKPSDIALLEGPGVPIGRNTPRVGIEREWFEVTGRVTHVKVERDGDLHVQLADANASPQSRSGYLIVEVPEGSPWCAIRQQIFTWTDASFPLNVGKGKTLELTAHPVVTVVGRAFYDANHATGGNTTLNARRGVGNVTASIWEIHPVMRLRVM
jgi:hypothetical protein